MNGRMADVLLYLNSFKTDFADIFELLGRKDIANFAGMTTENAVKILKSFEKDGLIELTNKDIVMKNFVDLKEISKRG
jgi:CRP/FNR family transcriptional regulator